MDVAAVTSKTIREEVAELLGIDPGDVDPDSDLIGQGLDSIRMMSLAGQWRKRGVAVDFATLAASPSVRAWSELVTGSGETHLVDDRQEVAAPLVDSGALADSAEDQPFPLAPMQHAMWVGRHDEQQLGGVAGHLYVEFDGGAVDPERTEPGRDGVGDRHPMLRVEFLPDGTQRIGPAQTRFRLRSRIFAGVPTPTVDRLLAAIRREQVAPAARRGGVRADAVAVAGRALAPARRPGHAGRRRDELPHADGRSRGAVSGSASCPIGSATRNTVEIVARRERDWHDADREWWSAADPRAARPAAAAVGERDRAG